jgi:PAS domain S-box-containing protein
VGGAEGVPHGGEVRRGEVGLEVGEELPILEPDVGLEGIGERPERRGVRGVGPEGLGPGPEVVVLLEEPSEERRAPRAVEGVGEVVLLLAEVVRQVAVPDVGDVRGKGVPVGPGRHACAQAPRGLESLVVVLGEGGQVRAAFHGRTGWERKGAPDPSTGGRGPFGGGGSDGGDGEDQGGTAPESIPGPEGFLWGRPYRAPCPLSGALTAPYARGVITHTLPPGLPVPEPPLPYRSFPGLPHSAQPMPPLSLADRQLPPATLSEVPPARLVAGGVLTFVIFLADVLTPLGVAGGVPYIAPVYLAVWLPGRWGTLAVASLCTVLIGVGWWLSPAGATTSIVITNRALAVGALWTVALLSLQRKGSEAALSESEAALRAVLSTTADAILTLGPGGRVTSANPAAAAIFGYPEAELVGRPLPELLAGGGEGLLPERGASARGSGAGQTPSAVREVTGLRRGGAPVPLEALAVPLPHPDGLRYTLTVRDITDRRLLEQHLLRTSDAERRAVGYSLHEELGQSLTGLGLLSRQLARRLGQRNADEAAEAAELTDLLRDVDRQALALYRSIAPLEATGDFGEALEGVVAETARRHGVEVSVRHGAIAAPGDGFEAAQVCTLVRDLLNALLKGGGIERVGVRTGSEGEAGWLRLRLHGGDPGAADRADRLRPLAYRAALFGARVEHTASGDGVEVVECRWGPQPLTPTTETEGQAHPAQAAPPRWRPPAASSPTPPSDPKERERSPRVPKG